MHAQQTLVVGDAVYKLRTSETRNWKPLTKVESKYI